MAVLASCLWPASQPLSFQEVSIPVGPDPESVAMADVNRDGHTDILIANTGAAAAGAGHSRNGTITVLLGDGKGHFHPARGSPFAAGPYPNDIAIGDLNRDGTLDLVIPNHQTPYVTVLLGDGDGRFHSAPHSPFATQSHPHPHGVALGDFNGDGKLDVVIDSWARNQVNLILGDGSGNLLTPGRMFDVGKRPYERVHSADVNKDGHPDVITTNMDSNNVTVLLGDGKGAFQEGARSPFAAGVKPWALATDDINKDGNLDLVAIPYAPDVSNPAQIAVTILAGDGRGGFAPLASSPLSLKGCGNPTRIATGDLNGDGLRDIVVSCLASDDLMIFMGERNGGFERLTHGTGHGPDGIAIADLNGDGKDDIVVANSRDNTITILLSR